MKILKGVVLTIFYFISYILFSVIIALVILFGYFYLQMFLFGPGNYLLFVSNELNMIPVIMLILLYIYAIFSVREKMMKTKENQRELEGENDELIDIETLSKWEKLLLKLIYKLQAPANTMIKIYKVIKVCYISALIIAIYCGMTSYAILYSDSIEVSTPMTPMGIVYSYDNINSIDVGIAKKSRNYYSPYYKIILDDGRTVDVFGGSMHEDNEMGFEHILLDLDKELRSQGISKRANKENFEKYSQGLNKAFISRVERLFDDQ